MKKKENAKFLITTGSLFFILSTILRWLSLNSDIINPKDHSSLIILMLTSSADCIDFFEYIESVKIVKIIGHKHLTGIIKIYKMGRACRKRRKSLFFIYIFIFLTIQKSHRWFKLITI